MVRSSIKMSVSLGDEEKVRRFVDRIAAMPFGAELANCRDVADAKVFSMVSGLDRTMPLDLTVHATPDECDDFINWLGQEGMLCKERA